MKLLFSLIGLSWQYCKDVQNRRNEGFSVRKDWWSESGRHEFDGQVTIQLGREKIRNWTVQVTFNAPTEVDEIWDATPWKVGDGQVWHFTTKGGNFEQTGEFAFNFLAGHWDGWIDGDVVYCTDDDKPGQESSSTQSTRTSSQTNPTESPGNGEWPTIPPGLCNGPTGRNVNWSEQSVVGGYTPFRGGKYDYAEVLHKSILFYEAQRAGPQPDSNRIRWRGDSALHDGCDVGRSLQMGWFDAGDHVKFNFPMAASATMLGWGLIDHREGYDKAGEYNRAVDSLRWAYSYLMEAHPDKYTIHMQVGDGYADHGFWGRPEEMGMYRPIFTLNRNAPGTELACETAAALSTCYIIFKDIDSSFANNCLQHARDLYDFGNEVRGSYSDSSPQVQDFYKSWSGYNDELCWGALWLYRATNEARYLQMARDNYANGVSKLFSWDDKWPGAQVLMAQLTSDAGYVNDVRNYFNMLKYETRTPKGLIWLNQWGPNRYAANGAMLMLHANKYLNRMPESERREWYNLGKSQIDYMLGDGGRSFVVGFGNNPPKKPHHRSSSCPGVQEGGCPNGGAWGDNPFILYGALVGGPDQWDNYNDDRNDYIANEVACDYNAGFQTALSIIMS